jgi:hypothetical protein
MILEIRQDTCNRPRCLTGEAHLLVVGRTMEKVGEPLESRYVCENICSRSLSV